MMRDDSLEDWWALPPSPGRREKDVADGEVNVFCTLSAKRAPLVTIATTHIQRAETGRGQTDAHGFTTAEEGLEVRIGGTQRNIRHRVLLRMSMADWEAGDTQNARRPFVVVLGTLGNVPQVLVEVLADRS